MISSKETNILRQLAYEYMQLASLPVHKEKIHLWKALNRCKMERPMVIIDQLPWHELSVDKQLLCEISDPFWRGIEENLRRTLYCYKHFPVDMVLDPFISIPKSITNSGYGLVPSEDTLGDKSSSAYSHQFKSLIKSMDDLHKITDMKILHAEKDTELHLEEADVIFKGIAPFKSTGISFHLGIWDYISMIINVEDIYYYLLDEPELLHALLERLTGATIAGIDEANRLGVHNDTASTCHCAHIFTDELLPDCGVSKGPYSSNCWAFGLAQVFTAVSPDVFAEFELPYISRMAEKFGMVYYGCCDRLDNKLEHVKKIPHVKKVSCSPWSNREAFAQNIGQNLVMSYKPNPAYLANTMDEDVIRSDLQQTVELAKLNHVNLELVLKDVSTVAFKPERLQRWGQIAMEVVNN